MTKEKNKSRNLEWWEIRTLQQAGCTADDWDNVTVTDATDLSLLRDVDFEGRVSLSAMTSEAGACIRDARLRDCRLGDDVRIRNVRSALVGCTIRARARIEDVERIEFEPGAACGIGTEVCVLDETGSRPVTIYPGITAQIALLMAREPKWAENHLKNILSDYIDSLPHRAVIGEGAVIHGCGLLMNVSVDREVTVRGARALRNGSIINNAGSGRCLALVGDGVDAENFIIEDGIADSGAIIRNCYIGQGASVEKGFSAHDSLFFANCSLENGEACALFAGPYTVSMHKSTLLIGCQTSFMNAGSGTNQSNHMYKLGPVHWGILERGVKTASASYLMLGAKIGAFSLLMGQHKTHPDSSQFPFSYLFGDDRGATVVVPGVMLRSCGLLRDEKKWPARDRRAKRKLPLHDRVVFDVLNPLTVDAMLTALDVIEKLLTRPADDDRYLRYKGMKFTRASLERARNLYELAIYKYLHLRTAENGLPPRHSELPPADWIDMAGLLMPRSYLDRALECTTIPDMKEVFDEAFQHYPNLERAWIAARFGDRWRRPAEVIAAYASDFDRMIDEDRHRYLEDLAAQTDMLRL